MATQILLEDMARLYFSLPSLITHIYFQMNEQWSEQNNVSLTQGSSCIYGNACHAVIASRTTGFFYNIDQAQTKAEA